MQIDSGRARLASHCYSLLFTRPLFLAGQALRILKNRTRRTEPFDPSRVRSIALLRLDLLGDFVVFSAVLRSLREHFPQAHIALFLNSWVCTMAAHCPYVDEIVPVPVAAQKWRQFLFGPFQMIGLARRKLWGRFELVINARHDRDTAAAGVLAHFSLAPQVMGFPTSAERAKALYNRGADSFYTHLFPVSATACHEVELHRRILAYLGVPCDETRPELWLSTADKQEAERMLKEAGWKSGDRLICLGMHAGDARRMWPADSYLELVAQIESIAACKFLLIGSKANWAHGELLRPSLGASLINLAGKGSLRGAAAAMAECDIYIGSDTGPMHIAAALGKPVVEISCHPRDGDPAHFQSPVRWAALTDRFVLLSPEHALPPCGPSCEANEPHCLRQVSASEVLHAVQSLLPELRSAQSGVGKNA